MEYAKEKIYPVEYSNRETKKINSTNNFLGLLFSLGGIFSIANIIVIYNFFRILSNV